MDGDSSATAATITKDANNQQSLNLPQYKRFMALSLTKRDRRPNFSQAELMVFISAVESRLELVRGKRLNRCGVVERMSSVAMMRGWGEVAGLVNTVGDVVRTGQEMRDKWCDLKSRVKRKEILIRNKGEAQRKKLEESNTEDVVCLSPPTPAAAGLSNIEERVSRIIRKINSTNRLPTVSMLSAHPRRFLAPMSRQQRLQQQQQRSQITKNQVNPQHVVSSSLRMVSSNVNTNVSVSSPTLPEESAVGTMMAIKPQVPSSVSIVAKPYVPVEQAARPMPTSVDTPVISFVSSLPEAGAADMTRASANPSPMNVSLTKSAPSSTSMTNQDDDRLLTSRNNGLSMTNSLLQSLVEKQEQLSTTLTDLVRETTRRRLIEEETLEALQMLVSVQNRRLQLEEQRTNNVGHVPSSGKNGLL